MTLPHIFGPIAGGTQIPLSFLDDNFNALGAMTIIPCTASGTNAISLTPLANTTAPAAYANYQMFGFVAANTSTGALTAAFLALGARNVYLANGTTQAGSGDIVAGVFYIVAFNSVLNGGAGGFEIMSPATNLTPGVASPVQTLVGDHTVVAAERGTEFRMNSGVLHTLSLPSGAAAGNGFNIEVYQLGTGGYIIAANGADRILSKGSSLASIEMFNVGDGGRLVCDGATPAVWSWKGRRTHTSLIASTISTDTAAPHGLGVAPDFTKVQLICGIINLNYAVNDVVELGFPQINAGGGFVMLPDATNLNFKTANTAIGIPNKTTFIVTAITTADWTYSVTATVLD